MIESPIDALKKAANLNGEKFQSLSDFKRLSLNKSIDNNGKKLYNNYILIIVIIITNNILILKITIKRL